MNFAVSFILVVLSSLVKGTNARPSDGTKDPMAGVVYVFEDGSRVAFKDISRKIQGTCKLQKATMEFGLNKNVPGNFCGGSCDSSLKSCEACKPTASGKKPLQVQLKNEDGSTVTKTFEHITECECAKC